MENLEQGVAAKLLIDVMDKAKAILNSLSQSLEVSIHLQALELIENGMTREAVDALEKLVARSRVSLGTSASRPMLDDVMNKLVKEPGRANPFFSLVNTADENLMKILLKDSNLNKLAASDGILTLTGARSPLEITNLLHLQFEGSIEGFESWSQRLLKQGIDVQKQILDLLESRGSSVTPQSLLRVSETGTALSQEVIDGLGRLVSTARGTTGTLARFEEMIQLISNDKMESFLKTVGQLPKDKFDEIFQLVNEPAKAGRLINYTNDTQQLLNMLDSAGGKSTELDTLIEGTKKLPNASNEIESLLNRYSGNIEKLNEFAKQVNGDAALLERSIVKMGKKEVEEILQKGQAQAVTKTDPASMQRFLKMAESNSWADPGKLKGFIERIHSNQAQLFKHTFENALDRLDDFVVHHSKSTSPPAVTPGFGPLNLAAKDSFFEITLTGGTKITPHANANNLQHYKEGHTFENFWFDPVKIDRAGVSTFWPPGTIDDVLLKDLVDALQTNDCRTMIETQMGMGKSFVRSPPLIDLAGTKFQIGMNVPTKLEANMFFPMEGARAVRVSKHILHGVKDLLGL